MDIVATKITTGAAVGAKAQNSKAVDTSGGFDFSSLIKADYAKNDQPAQSQTSNRNDRSYQNSTSEKKTAEVQEDDKDNDVLDEKELSKLASMLNAGLLQADQVIENLQHVQSAESSGSGPNVSATDMTYDPNAPMGGEQQLKSVPGDLLSGRSGETEPENTQMFTENAVQPQENLVTRRITSGGGGPSGEASNDTNGPGGRASSFGPGPGTVRTSDTGKQEGMTSAEKAAAANAALHAQSSGVQPAVSQNAMSDQVTTMTMRTSETTVVDDLTNVLSTAMPRQNGSMTIELDPQNLGKISITVNYDADRATVTIAASNQRTMEMLSQNASQMGTILEQKTGQATLVYVPAAPETSQGQNMNSDNAGQGEGQQQQQNQQAQQAQGEKSSASEAFLQQMRLGLI